MIMALAQAGAGSDYGDGLNFENCQYKKSARAVPIRISPQSEGVFAIIRSMPGFIKALGGSALLLCAGCTASEEITSPAPDTIFFNGKIVTVDPNFSYAEALAITGEHFSAVGTSDEILSSAGPDTQMIDLAGRTVLPGLMDNHLHNAGGGPGVDISRARSLDEVLNAIAARLGESEAGDLVLTNRDWHEAQLVEQRLPLRRDLDAIAPDNPVIVIRGGHEYILNSVALARWNIDETTDEPEGGQISRYPDGTLNGELLDRARLLVDLPPTPEQTLDEKINERVAQYEILHAAGLTSVRHPSGSIEEYRLLQEIQRRGLLTMRITHLMRLRDVNSPEDIQQRLEAWGVQPREGDNWLKNGGIKLGVDGGFEGGWMRAPYAAPFDQDGSYYGINTTEPENYLMTVQELNRLQWPVSTHAVGDAAIDLVLDAYERVNEEQSIFGKRWTIEHGFIPAQDHFPRIRNLGLTVSAQNHLYVAGPSLEKYWGRTRADWVTPVRTYLDENISISGGTDASVVPFPPLWVLYHFITRDTITGGVFGANQAITREEAVRLITISNAHLTFEEGIKGSIETGKLADLVVLSDDIMTCPATCIRDADIVLTMVGGQIVFENPTFQD
jgi:predicted amidohydrolase YtcJ